MIYDASFRGRPSPSQYPLADSFAQFRPPAGGAISGAQFLLPTIHSNPRLKFETEHQDSNLFFLFLFIDSSPK